MIVYTTYRECEDLNRNEAHHDGRRAKPWIERHGMDGLMLETYEDYVEVEGGRVWYRLAGTGSRTPMLCVHGGPGVPHDVLLPLIEQVGPDRPVVFYDQLGCGRSAGPTDPDRFSLENLFAEVAAVRDAVGLTDYHLYGQSAGTAIASGFAKHNMRGIKSFVLSSAVLDEEHWRP
jgi:proline-specific peptidase